ncbi:MAG: lysoplasmalogenase family protein [Gammaproteobacteria bacterium]|nr:lysoplasmalogenase family protein [Gammaproteobacteria bacterium]
MSNLNKPSLLTAAHLFAFLYWINCQHKNGSTLIISTKIMSTFLLALHNIKNNPHNKSRNAALLAHCFGDLLIELPVEKPILLAIPAFFIGHLCCSLHLMQSCITMRELNLKKQMGLAAFTIASGLITREINAKTTGIMAYLIPVYGFALGTLFILSALQKQQAKPSAIAALSYIASDVLIAVNAFVFKIPHVNYATWPLYFLSQASSVSQSNTGSSEVRTQRSTAE